MGSSEQVAIDLALAGVPPREDVTLRGWVMTAEWVESDGQRFLTRLVAEGTSSWQVKGYLHEGLFSRWPNNLAHHNPGHPADWAVTGLE